MIGRVPYLREEQIERETVRLLAEYSTARGIALEPPVPIDDIVETYLRLGVEFDDLHQRFGVPRPADDPEILGAIFFGERRIAIDESLDPEEFPLSEGRYRFTLAHEGGHWWLHRELFVDDSGQAQLFAVPAKPSVVCRSSQAKQPIEWQANYFASCLLMPRRPILEVWRRELGNDKPLVFDSARHDPAILRKWSHLRPIGAPDYDSFFNSVARHFAQQFCVSTQAMRIRLEQLGLLLRQSPRQRMFCIDV